ncbi:MAG: molybdopterin-dependent oxidoreductase [Actinomycetota bacterium]|nr:molybdopterin-dependent oxidoreductase [Actinomycetota bacterium]
MSPQRPLGGSDRLRIGPLKAEAFSSPLHSQRLAAILGIALGVTFSICFATGLLSDLIQTPPAWFIWPARPVGLYRVTQGLHVATGFASIPLLLAKLWIAYPRLWAWPPVAGLLHVVERISLIPLVGGSLFLLFTGVLNIGFWYPWNFFFPTGHYWAAWVTIGALVVHIGAKATLARHALGRGQSRSLRGDSHAGLTRRGLLGAVTGAIGLITLTTAGQTFSPLRRLAFLAPYVPGVGPQGFPVVGTANSDTVDLAERIGAYRLSVAGAVEEPLELSLEELQALPQYEADLPIACVNGWSQTLRWRGVRLADLVRMAGAPSDSSVTVQSLQPGTYDVSLVNPVQLQDPGTMLALQVNGEPLHVDHGFPVRLIGPNRPGVTNTKWVQKVTVD